jgi:hypothetical protein
MTDGGEAQSYLGAYGVVVVPPEGETGQWFVTVAAWDQQGERYVAGTTGPFCDTAEEALAEAAKIAEWIRGPHPSGMDLVRVWEEMQRQLGAEAGREEELPRANLYYGPWG